MDTDWTFSSRSWLWEEDVTFKISWSGSTWSRDEDKAFENALAIYYNDADRWDKIALAVPGKTIEDLKLHYEALSNDVVAIESGKVPLPHYPSKVSVRRKRKKPSTTSVQRGIPWTEEEHRRFLYGLQRFGRGDWKSISRYSVRTKSNSQVASHAQKYFKRLKANEGKRPSINDIRSVHPESLLALENATTSCMPRHPKEKSTNTGNQHRMPRKRKKASSDRNQLPPGHSKGTSTNAGNQLFKGYPNEASSSDVNKLLPGCPKVASKNAGNQLSGGHPKESSTSAGSQLLPGYPKDSLTNVGNLLFSRYSNEASANVGNRLLPGYPDEISTDARNVGFTGYSKAASANVGSQLLPPTPCLGMSVRSFSGHAIADPGISAGVVPACSMFTPSVTSRNIQEPGTSVEMPAYHPLVELVQDGGVPAAGSFDIPSITPYSEIIDLDMFVLPHFLD